MHRYEGDVNMSAFLEEEHSPAQQMEIGIGRLYLFQRNHGCGILWLLS